MCQLVHDSHGFAVPNKECRLLVPIIQDGSSNSGDQTRILAISEGPRRDQSMVKHALMISLRRSHSPRLERLERSTVHWLLRIALLRLVQEDRPNVHLSLMSLVPSHPCRPGAAAVGLMVLALLLACNPRLCLSILCCVRTLERWATLAERALVTALRKDCDIGAEASFAALQAQHCTAWQF